MKKGNATDTTKNEGYLQRLSSRAANEFPRIFQAQSPESNRCKAREWLKKCNGYLARLNTDTEKRSTITNCKIKGPASRRDQLKSLCGRGRKGPVLKQALFSAVLEEFQRMRSAGSKMTRRLVQEISIELVNDYNVPIYPTEIEIHTGRPLWAVLIME